MYPYRASYRCPDCVKGTMTWRGEEFHGTYVLGRSYCDNPHCPNYKDNWLRPMLPSLEEIEKGVHS